MLQINFEVLLYTSSMKEIRVVQEERQLISWNLCKELCNTEESPVRELDGEMHRRHGIERENSRVFHQTRPSSRGHFECYMWRKQDVFSQSDCCQITSSDHDKPA